MTAWTLDAPHGPAAQTGAVPTATPAEEIGSGHRAAWNRVVDEQLIPWGNGRADVDPDLLPPSPSSIRSAAVLAHRFRDAGERPPTAVLPNGDGGVLFEYRTGRLASVQLEVLHDGDVERTEYDDAGLVGRHLYPADLFI